MTDIVEDLREGYRRGFCCTVGEEAANEIERLRARDKDLTLEGLGLIGRIEQARDALAGTDAASLPRDYPLERMAQDRMAEIERLRAAIEDINVITGTPRPGASPRSYLEQQVNHIARAALGGENV